MRILIWGEAKPGGAYDIYRKLDYLKVYDELNENYQATCINVGNKVWIQGIVSALSTEDNELFFYNPKETWDEINERYDKIVYSAANMFYYEYRELIQEVAELFKKSRLPIYVIAIGAQAAKYDEIGELSCSLKKEISNFVDSVYTTGGEIACRGYFTKELLDSVCTNSAVVTGCPSLFQNGRGLNINKIGKDINPVFNGNLKINKQLSVLFPQSVYIDQDEWVQLTYDVNCFYKKSDEECLVDLIAEKGKYETKLFLEDRIKVFYDMPEWHRFLINGNFNFSIGSRIHGNIMALLSNIPALVCAIDSRTREMAEFYDIPYYFPSEKSFNVQKLYDELDYGRFNRTFAGKFDVYEQFLQKCGLVKKINEDNIFWNKEEPLHKFELRKARENLLHVMTNASMLQQLRISTSAYISKKKRNSIKKIVLVQEKY